LQDRLYLVILISAAPQDAQHPVDLRERWDSDDVRHGRAGFLHQLVTRTSRLALIICFGVQLGFQPGSLRGLDGKREGLFPCSARPIRVVSRLIDLAQVLLDRR
jgi:hypothetical protein